MFDHITTNVYFEGVSGNVNFDSVGDLLNPAFSLSNYRTPVDNYGANNDTVNGEWIVIGNVSETSFHVDMSLLEWPGAAADASSFSNQLKPWCLAGYEPLLTYVTGWCRF